MEVEARLGVTWDEGRRDLKSKSMFYKRWKLLEKDGMEGSWDKGAYFWEGGSTILGALEVEARLACGIWV